MLASHHSCAGSDWSRRSRSTTAETAMPPVWNRGFANSRTKPVSVSGQVAHPARRFSANQS